MIHIAMWIIFAVHHRHHLTLSTPRKQSSSVKTQSPPKYDNFDSDICFNICSIEEPNRTPETLYRCWSPVTTSSEPGLSTSYSEIWSSQFRQSKRSLRASFDIDSILLWKRENGVIIMSSAARSDLKMNTFLSPIFEYLRKLIRKARRTINSKIEGAKMIHTLLRSSIYEIDTQIWLAERLGLVDVNKLTSFFCSMSMPH